MHLQQLCAARHHSFVMQHPYNRLLQWHKAQIHCNAKLFGDSQGDPLLQTEVRDHHRNRLKWIPSPEMLNQRRNKVIETISVVQNGHRSFYDSDLRGIVLQSALCFPECVHTLPAQREEFNGFDPSVSS